MAHDPSFRRFFLYLNLFMFAMLTLVLADNFLLMFVGWEGVGPLLVPADRVLVRASRRRPRRARRRSSSTASATSASCSACCSLFSARRLASHFETAVRGRAARCSRSARRGDHDRDAAAVPRRHRQERADPALRLAARRDGGPDAGLGADPRRDDGHRRRVHGRALPRAVRASRRSRSRWWRSIGAATALFAATIGARPERHQARARLLDGEPARLHVHGLRRRRVHAPASST